MPLFSDARYEDGRRTSEVPWEGASVRVNDDAETALRLVAALSDEGLMDSVRSAVVMELLFRDPVAVVRHGFSDLEGLVRECLWRVAGIDADGSRAEETQGERVIDWDADADCVRASVWQSYGVSAEDMMRRTSMREFGRLVGMCPRETPIGTALYYRTAEEPKQTKYNEDQVRAFRKARAFWRLDKPEGGSADEGTAASNDAASAFAGLARSARR